MERGRIMLGLGLSQNKFVKPKSLAGNLTGMNGVEIQNTSIPGE